MSAVAQSVFRALDPRFEEVLGDDARLELVAGVDAHEGPVFADDEDALYFTTVRRERVSIARLDLTDGSVAVVVADANNANGMALGPEGRLVVCEQGTFDRPARTSLVDRATGLAETVVDSYGGYRLNSPNDVVVHSDGTIWFTDPSYGHLQGFRPRPEVTDSVYRYDPRSGHLAIVANLFDKPNGLAFSPDEQTLYVGDNGRPHHLIAFDVAYDRSLQHRRIVAVGTPEHPDGVKVDSEGRMYVSSRTGIQVLDPTGRRLGEIELPGAVNFAFGGPGRNTLFITADTAVWAAVLNAKGA
jgi:gluconolactonase